MKSKSYKKFRVLSSAKAKVHLALLDAMTLLWTEAVAERVVLRKDCYAYTLSALERATNKAFVEAGKKKATRKARAAQGGEEK